MARKIFYFDYAATTPVDRRVFKIMQPYFAENFGNPSNLYELGRRARRAIENALQKIAGALNCRPAEFIFTGSATEADNLAIAGIARAYKEFQSNFAKQISAKPNFKYSKKYGRNALFGQKAAEINSPRIIISGIEHKGILSVCEALKKEGFEVVKLPVLKNGLVDLQQLKKLLDKKTILVSVTYADSETGTIQPIAEISKLIAEFRKQKIKNRSGRNSALYFLNSNFPLFHSDASQAALYCELDVQKLGVDLMTLSGHKIYGPKGVGGLYVRQGVNLRPIIYGGGQQARLRAGTENVPGIVGFAEALVLAQKHRRAEAGRIKKLRDKLEKGIFKTIPKVLLNGHPAKRLPNFLNLSILDIEGEALLLYLDEKGIAVGTGSACNSESLEPSYILSALGRPYEYIHGSLRFTLGKYTKDSDINYVLKILPEIVRKLRKISPLNIKLNKKEKILLPKAFVGNQSPHFLRKRHEL
jgi:cysteine desulfurase